MMTLPSLDRAPPAIGNALIGSLYAGAKTPGNNAGANAVRERQNAGAGQRAIAGAVPVPPGDGFAAVWERTMRA